LVVVVVTIQITLKLAQPPAAQLHGTLHEGGQKTATRRSCNHGKGKQ